MWRPATVRVWQWRRKRTRCRFCRQWVVWVTTDENKRFPFNPDFVPRETVTHPETLARFDVVSYDDVHRCEEGLNAKRKQPKLLWR